VAATQALALQLPAGTAIPRHAQNATGENLATDGKIAVLLLR
jgi:hypothetical protein